MQNFNPSSIFFPCPVIMIGTFDQLQKPNLMNAAWGGIYDTNQVFICLDKSHKTSKNLLNTNEATISFATKETVRLADYSGCSSSNKQNKFEGIDIKYIKSDIINAPIFLDFPITLECHLNSFKDENNTLYCVFDILNIKVKDEYVKDNKIDTSNIDFISFDPALNTYRVIGDSIKKAFNEKEYKND